MKRLTANILTKIVFLLIAFLFTTSYAAALGPPVDLTKAEILKLGERMYRDGILPSGKVMPAFIRGDVEVDSSAFSCSSCHLRAGLGSVEGGVVTPPTTGVKLYKPYRRPPSLNDIPDRAGRIIYAKTVQERPAYTRETLAFAMRFGTDPAGQTFNDVMPRYPLSDLDMSILISYLELLSSEPSPGAGRGEFRFATVITDDVSTEDREALLLPLQTFISQKNQQQGLYKDFLNFGYVPTIDMKNAFHKATLDIWELKGPPSTWQAQLAGYYAKNPVFALLGGISNSDWQPIHDFCETQRIPCLFPVTDYPVLSETGWYTLYFNKGYFQEGEAVARYLNRIENLRQDSVLEIVQDSPAGKALSNGFQRGWSDLERTKVTTLTLSSKQLKDTVAMRKLLAKHKPEMLLLWADDTIVSAIPALVEQLASPGTVFVSSSYLGKKTAAIAESVRNRVYLTYPWRMTPFVGPKTGGYDVRIPTLATAKDLGDRRIITRTITMLQQATLQGLYLMYDNLYREHLLDVMSMQMDMVVRDYERFSFGPGQRYASKGCYIIQLGPGTEPELLPRSEWVIH